LKNDKAVDIFGKSYYQNVTGSMKGRLSVEGRKGIQFDVFEGVWKRINVTDDGWNSTMLEETRGEFPLYDHGVISLSVEALNFTSKEANYIQVTITLVDNIC
jgi:hypothetical protein